MSRRRLNASGAPVEPEAPAASAPDEPGPVAASPDPEPPVEAVPVEPEAPAVQAPVEAADRARVERRNDEMAVVDRALEYHGNAIGAKLTRDSLLRHMPGDGGPGYRVMRACSDPWAPRFGADQKWRIQTNSGREDGRRFKDREEAANAARGQNEKDSEITGVRIYTERGVFYFGVQMDRRQAADQAAR